MVDGDKTTTKQQRTVNNNNNKPFSEQNPTKIVLRRLPPTFTSEQFLEIAAPLPDHDYFRFCKADLSLSQQYACSRVYIDIPNRQDLIVFTEKFQGYVFLDKNGNEYICSVEYAPSQRKPKSEQQRKDPKVNTIEQDPEYEKFVASMSAPATAADALPNAETMLEEIEKKQRETHENKHKPNATSTPLLEYMKRKREERRQEKNARLQQAQQHRNKKQLSSRNSMNNEDSRLSTGRTTADDDFTPSPRYGGGDRSNRQQQRGYDKSDYRTANNEQQQKRSNAGDHGGNKPSKNRQFQNSKSKHQQNSPSVSNPTKQTTDSSLNTKVNNEELASSPLENQSRSSDVTTSANDTNQHSQNDERPTSSNKSSSAASAKAANAVPKNRPSIQIYNPGERVRLRRQQNPPSQ